MDIYPLCIIADRYSGVYSGAKYLAFNMDAYDVAFIMLHGADGDDTDCFEFWENDAKNYVIGKGDTPEKALEDLERILGSCGRSGV